MLSTIDAAGVSWYRQISIDSCGTAVPHGGWNCVTPCHEVVSCSHADRGGNTVVTFTISSSAWGARDDRRPQWLMFSRGRESLWPLVPQDSRYAPARLNIGFSHGYRFGRIVVR